jgi:photosystem II stability/assembly factor-like uncharacterized protein
MKSLYYPLRILLLFFIILLSAVAQETGEWNTTWEAAANNNALFPKGLATAGAGHYVLATSADVFRTTDAGITWKSIRSNGGGFSYIAHPSAEQVVVLTDSNFFEGDIYVHYGTILATSNGGTTWKEEKFSGRRWLRGLSMADATTGLVAMQVAGPADSLLLTIDGGMTWQRLPLPEGSRYPSEPHCLSTMSWAVKAFDTTEKKFHFYRTTNGGIQWSRAVNLPEWSGTVRFISDSLAWTVGGVATGVGQTNRDMIARSTDGGITWTTMLDTALDFRFGVNDIAFADANNGIAVGGFGKILRTTDGGTTWHQEWPPSDLIAEYINLKQVAYPTLDEAIAIGQGMHSIAYRGQRTLVAPRITLPITNLSDHPVQTTVVWTPIEGATSYDLQIGDTAYEYNFVNHRLFDVPYLERTDLTQTSLDVMLQPHVRYAIRVRARNATQTSDWSVRLDLLTQGEGKTLLAPAFTSPGNGAQGLPLDLELKWTEVPNATGYDLEVALDGAYIVTVADETNIPDAIYGLKDLKPATTYYAHVRARDDDGVTSLWSNANNGPLIFTTGGVASTGGGVSIDFAMSLRPNFTADRTAVELELSRYEDVEVHVVDIQGNDVTAHGKQRLTAGTHLLPVDVTSLAGGSYFVVVTIRGVQRQLPLTVVR